MIIELSDESICMVCCLLKRNLCRLPIVWCAVASGLFVLAVVGLGECNVEYVDEGLIATVKRWRFWLMLHPGSRNLTMKLSSGARPALSTRLNSRMKNTKCLKQVLRWALAAMDFISLKWLQ